MPLESDVWRHASALVPAGSEIQYLFPASVPTQGPLAHVLVVVTGTEILVLHTGFFSRMKPKAVWRRFPRRTRLGPVENRWVPRFTLGNHTFEIDDQYVCVVNAADAEIGAADYLPPDPYPDM